jgi:porin
MIRQKWIQQFIFFGILIFSGVEVKSQENPLSLQAGYTSDFVRNFAGGIKKGDCYLGLIDLSATLNTDDAKLWKGGSFLLHGETAMGSHPSEEMVGDIQVVSNIDGAPRHFLYEFWYNQTLENFSILGGLNNLNNFFYVSSFSGSFINSSFGIAPSLSLNNPISIFPVTTLGGLIKYDKPSFSILAGFYNLNHNLTEEQNFSFKDHLFNHGYFTLTEAQFRLSKDEEISGEYKIGGWFKRCNDDHEHRTEECPSASDFGLYAMADQVLFKRTSNEKIGGFVQAGYSPQKYNVSSFYSAIGFNFIGFLTHKGKDEISIALASARINYFLDSSQEFVYLKNESVIELTCKLNIHKNIILQPDLQYIIHPAGTDGLQNAFVGLLRTKINF